MVLIALALAWQGAWASFAILVGLLTFYVLAVRLTRCRVETKKAHASLSMAGPGTAGNV